MTARSMSWSLCISACSASLYCGTPSASKKCSSAGSRNGQPSRAASIRPLRYSPRLAQYAADAPERRSFSICRSSASRSMPRRSSCAICRNLAATGAKAASGSAPVFTAAWQSYSRSVTFLSSAERFPGAETTTKRSSGSCFRLSVSAPVEISTSWMPIALPRRMEDMPISL